MYMKRRRSNEISDNILQQSDILTCIAKYLLPNEVSCGLRLVNKVAAAHLREQSVVRLSQPSPNSLFVAKWCNDSAMRPLTVNKRRDLLSLTAASGDLANLQAAVAAAGLLPFPSAYEGPAESGHLHICQWLRSQGWPLEQTALVCAARGGHSALCQWLLAQGCQPSSEAADAAAAGGHTHIATLLTDLHPYEHCITRLDSLLRAAPLAVVQDRYSAWLTTNPRVHRHSLILHAASSPKPDWRVKVEWLEGLGAKRVDPFITAAVAGCGPDATERLAWLRDRGYRCDGSAVAAAARAGNTATIHYLLNLDARQLTPSELHRDGVQDGARKAASKRSQNGVRMTCNFGTSAAIAAAKAGRLDVLELLRSYRVQLRPWMVVVYAAAGGHVAVVDWLVRTYPRAVGPVVPGLVRQAALSGSVELMTWLAERKTLLGEAGVGGVDVFCAAVEGGSEAVIEWLLERGCPVPDDGTPCYAIACGQGDLRMLSCLRRLGLPWAPDGRTFTAAAGELLSRRGARFAGSGLGWLLAEGCPVDWAALDALVAERQRDYEAFVGFGVTDEQLAWLRDVRQRHQSGGGAGGGVAA